MNNEFQCPKCKIDIEFYLISFLKSYLPEKLPNLYVCHNCNEILFFKNFKIENNDLVFDLE